MNKKLNYILFIIAATVVNIIIMILLYLIPLILLILIFKEDSNNSLMPFLYLIVLPMLSIAGGYLIYSRIYKLFRQKVDMEKYFEPIFKKKRY